MVDSTVKYIAVGNHGGIFMLVSEYPRKELMERMHASRAEKCYIDKLDGTSAHIGYIVSGQWFTLYAVEGRGVREGGVR